MPMVATAASIVAEVSMPLAQSTPFLGKAATGAALWSILPISRGELLARYRVPHRVYIPYIW